MGNHELAELTDLSDPEKQADAEHAVPARIAAHVRPGHRKDSRDVPRVPAKLSAGDSAAARCVGFAQFAGKRRYAQIRQIDLHPPDSRRSTVHRARACSNWCGAAITAGKTPAPFAEMIRNNVLINRTQAVSRKASSAPNDTQIILDCCADKASYVILPTDRPFSHANPQPHPVVEVTSGVEKAAIVRGDASQSVILSTARNLSRNEPLRRPTPTSTSRWCPVAALQGHRTHFSEAISPCAVSMIHHKRACLIRRLRNQQQSCGWGQTGITRTALPWRCRRCVFSCVGGSCRGKTMPTERASHLTHSRQRMQRRSPPRRSEGPRYRQRSRHKSHSLHRLGSKRRKTSDT